MGLKEKEQTNRVVNTRLHCLGLGLRSQISKREQKFVQSVNKNLNKLEFHVGTNMTTIV